MKMLFFKNAGEAERGLREKDKEYLIMDHELSPGEVIEADKHESTEWIILGPGKGLCKVTVGDRTELIDFSVERAIVVVVPAEAENSLEALDKIIYTVMRDGLK